MIFGRYPAWELAMTPGLLKVAAAAGMAATLVGCAANEDPLASAQASLSAALAVGCPIVAAFKAVDIPLNIYQASALNMLALACPPNPPPSSTNVVVADLVNAYMILRPLIK
jgi:hypothetical protein